MSTSYCKRRNVAPHTGAWIETAFAWRRKGADLSHPTRVRGLKLETNLQNHKLFYVAPHTGAWIET